MLALNGFLAALSTALLHSVWQVAVLGLLAALSLEALRRASAACRHTVGMTWLLVMAAAPMLTFWHCLSARSAAPLLGPAGQSVPGLWPPMALALAPLPDAVAGGWMLALTALWCVAVLLRLVLYLGGRRWLARLTEQHFDVLPAPWQQRVDDLRAALQLSRTVVVRVVDDVAAPFTAWLLRPVIWLPRSLLDTLPAQQLVALLAHELAHVRRLDWLWNGVQRLIEALLCHHPAVWWLGRRIRQERELACDDLAVAVCGDALAMAEALAHLGSLAQRPLFSPRTAREQLVSGFPHGGLAAQGGQLMARISHLLGTTPAARPWRWVGGLALLAASGSLLATQVLPPSTWLMQLRTDQSAPGPLAPGQFQDMTATYLGGYVRHYRVSMDDRWQRQEQYQEDGQPRPVTADVRQWVAAMQRFSGEGVPLSPVPLPDPRPEPRPSQPLLPALPPLASLPSLPDLPSQAELAPSSPPQTVDSADYRTLMLHLASDPRVIAAVGGPAQSWPDSFEGQLRTADLGVWPLSLLEPWFGARANFSMRFSGPQGEVQVAFAGRTQAGQWHTDQLRVTPLQRSAQP